ncbi:MAG: 3-hydroxyacyl-ACP dehydratase FabZ family protein [Minisyncoccales bacterium]
MSKNFRKMKVDNICKEEVAKLMPYKEPFFFIDKVIKLDSEKGEIVTEKKFNSDYEFFNCHFTDFPIVPGVLILEATGQAASYYVRKISDESKQNNLDVLAYEIKSAKISNPSFPDDVLRFELKMKDKTPFWWNDKKPKILSAKANVFCGNDLRGKATFDLAVLDKGRFRKRFLKK